jgi:alkanesulfonate monooxygenase SsuD/methylene tetrahydromethanopterin reductase-like flavin-dependent oxidoreductase (luciferase family)
VRRAQGEYLPLESPEAAAAYPYTPSDRERLARHRARLAVGSADRVKDRLLALADATRADEIIVTTMVFDHAARRHSYELLAKAFALPQ